MERPRDMERARERWGGGRKTGWARKEGRKRRKAAYPSSKKNAGSTLRPFFWIILTLRNLPVGSSMRSESSTCGHVTARPVRGDNSRTKRGWCAVGGARVSAACARPNMSIHVPRNASLVAWRGTRRSAIEAPMRWLEGVRVTQEVRGRWRLGRTWTTISAFCFCGST